MNKSDLSKFVTDINDRSYIQVSTDIHYSKVHCHLDEAELRAITQAVLSALTGEGWEYKLVRVNKNEGEK